jgi:ABC-type sulfate/molybdate transport systems ATPase subunit
MLARAIKKVNTYDQKVGFQCYILFSKMTVRSTPAFGVQPGQTGS